MKPARHPGRASERAYMLIELLVYMALVFLLLGLGYTVVYKYVDQSLVLRRSAEDIALALDVGERWRAEVRAATTAPRLEVTPRGQELYLSGPKGEVAYRFAHDAVSRRAGSGPWVVILPHVSACTMSAEPRHRVTAWRWDLELQPRARGNLKPGRVHPWFTFLSAPSAIGL